MGTAPYDLPFFLEKGKRKKRLKQGLRARVKGSALENARRSFRNAGHFLTRGLIYGLRAALWAVGLRHASLRLGARRPAKLFRGGRPPP